MTGEELLAELMELDAREIYIRHRQERRRGDALAEDPTPWVPGYKTRGRARQQCDKCHRLSD